MINRVECVDGQPQCITQLCLLSHISRASVSRNLTVHSHLYLFLVFALDCLGFGSHIFNFSQIAPINVAIVDIGNSCGNDSVNCIASIDSRHLMNFTKRVLCLLHERLLSPVKLCAWQVTEVRVDQPTRPSSYIT